MDKTIELEEKIKALQNERSAIHEEMAPLQNRLYTLYDELKPLEEELSKIKIAEYKANAPNWKMLVKRDYIESLAMIRYMDQVFREHFDMYPSGVWSETNESSIKIKIEKNEESLRKNILGVKTLTPLYTPRSEDGLVWFSIFENSLSRFGAYYLKVSPNMNLVLIGLGAYYNDKSFKSIEEAMKYIQDYLWYGEPYSDSDDY